MGLYIASHDLVEFYYNVLGERILSAKSRLWLSLTWTLKHTAPLRLCAGASTTVHTAQVAASTSYFVTISGQKVHRSLAKYIRHTSHQRISCKDQTSKARQVYHSTRNGSCQCIPIDSQIFCKQQENRIRIQKGMSIVTAIKICEAYLGSPRRSAPKESCLQYHFSPIPGKLRATKAQGSG